MSPPPEPGLSSRVWLDAAMTQIGLAMARSIGDHAVKSIGVVAEPEVTTHTIEVRGDCRRYGSGVGCDQVRLAVRGGSVCWLLFYGRSKPHHPCLQVDGDDAQTIPRVCLLRLRALDEQPRIDGPNDRTSQGKDKFIVLASDGVWEFISSQEAIDIVNLSLDEGTMKVKKALKANRCQSLPWSANHYPLYKTQKSAW